MFYGSRRLGFLGWRNWSLELGIYNSWLDFKLVLKRPYTRSPGLCSFFGINWIPFSRFIPPISIHTGASIVIHPISSYLIEPNQIKATSEHQNITTIAAPTHIPSHLHLQSEIIGKLSLQPPSKSTDKNRSHMLGLGNYKGQLMFLRLTLGFSTWIYGIGPFSWCYILPPSLPVFRLLSPSPFPTPKAPPSQSPSK